MLHKLQETYGRATTFSHLYVMRVYAFVWFSIKKFPNISEGSRHLWKVIEVSRFLPPEARKVIEETIQFNAFFGHHENLLLAMATDPSPEVRSLAWRRIKKSRKMPKKKGVREFRVPKLNTDARNYTEMINWQTCDLTEPPLTMKLSDKEIEENIKSAAVVPSSITSFPCHTQGVERLIRAVTEASEKVYGAETRTYASNYNQEKGCRR